MMESIAIKGMQRKAKEIANMNLTPKERWTALQAVAALAQRQWECEEISRPQAWHRPSFRDGGRRK